jgi:hypothetical protein
MRQDILAFFNTAAISKEPVDKEEKEAEKRRETLDAVAKLRALKL